MDSDMESTEAKAMAQDRLGLRILQVFASKCTITRSLAVIIIMLMGIVLVSFRIPIQDASFKYLANVSSETVKKTFRGLKFSADTGQPSPTASESSPSSDIGKKLTDIAKMYKVDIVSCRDVFLDKVNSTREARIVDKTKLRPLKSSQHYINITENCIDFQSNQGYVMSSLTQEEEEFPLAYSILTYKDPEMVERLLHAIYRPQNYYCIHVDVKSPDLYYKAIDSIARCFHNVFIASERIDVRWGEFSVLKPELVCMSDLWRYKKWKYFINLTGQEFPLKTNYELVKILKAYKGANDVSGTIKRANQGRWKNAGPPPHGIRAVKGSVHVVVNREFVDYILHNKTGQEFLNWTKKTSVPDETFFASLNHNPQLGIKGTYKGDPDIDERRKPFVSRHKIWYQQELCAGRFVRGICVLSTGHPDESNSNNLSPARYKVWISQNRKCAGRYIRSICVLSPGDLPRLGRSYNMFANKFFLWESQLGISCLEEKIFNNTRDEYLGIKSFNTSYYEQTDTVINQVQ